MIYGIGTDIVSIARIASINAKFPQNFAKRILTPQELQLWQTSKQANRYLAKRFAAKEAFAKAWGSGIRQYVSFANIEVINNQLGAPQLNFYQQLAIEMQHRQLRCHLSISDDKGLAIAYVIIETI